MFYKKLQIFFLLLLTSCVTTESYQNSISLNKKNFVSKGFALIYDDELYKEKIISKKLDNRDMIVLQKNQLHQNTFSYTNLELLIVLLNFMYIIS